MAKREYDIIVYGATGFTGKQTAQYLAANAPKDLKWAVAGRSESKLKSILPSLGDVPYLVVDSGDSQKVDEMTQKTKVLATTVGPYALYGRNIISSCAMHGTHYVDITGETTFVRDMMDSFAGPAERSEARIIPFCGFDSVPSDMGSYLLQKYMSESLGSAPDHICGYFQLKGGFNGGTFLSALNMFESGDFERMEDPGLLMPESSSNVRFVEDKESAFYDSDIEGWVAPFMMSQINTRVVNRSIALSAKFDEAYSDQMSYAEYHLLGGRYNPFAAVSVAGGMAAFRTIAKVGAVRNMLKKVGPKSSEGPSQEAIDGGYFEMTLIGTAKNGRKAKLIMRFNGDPGNKATITFLAEAALSLAVDEKKLPKKRAGFLTPATGLGDVYAERIQAAGLHVQISALS